MEGKKGMDNYATLSKEGEGERGETKEYVKEGSGEKRKERGKLIRSLQEVNVSQVEAKWKG